MSRRLCLAVAGRILHQLRHDPRTLVIIVAVPTVRERTSGTLERLMSTPLGRGDYLLGYALAFGLLAAVQASVCTAFAHWVLGMQTESPLGWVLLMAVVGSQLGVALGLLASAVSRSEFQAVQLFPALMLPQLLLCGLFGPRDQMADWLHAISAVLPLTYVVEALQELAVQPEPTALFWRDLGITAAVVVVLLALAAVTLRRRTA